MNNELYHSKNPLKLSLFWIAVYVLIAIFIFSGVNLASTQIRTHTLPIGTISLKIPYSKYMVGETISFSIINNYNSSIYILNNCPSEPLAVYRQENGVWVRQHDQAVEESCPSEQRQVSVAPGDRADGNFNAWPNLFSQPGKYRVVAFVEYYNSLPYQDIKITPSVTNATNTNTNAQPTVIPKSSDEEYND